MAHERIKRLLACLGAFRPLFEAVAQAECRASARWASRAHKRLMAVQWLLPPTPEHFDHTIDQYYLWHATDNPLWLERGVFSSLAVTGGDVLELACGDGFNARHFY